MNFIMVLYYVITAILAVFLVVNLIKTKDRQKVVLYAMTLLPLLLRLLRFK